MKEEEIRPRLIFAEYLRLCEEDTKQFFDGVDRVRGFCPACDSPGELSFTKHGFDYELCSFCGTLFVNPRPLAISFSRYYTQSASSEYWANTFYKETAQARKEKLWKPKTRRVREVLDRYVALGHRVVDVGGGYGLFAEEMGLLTNQPVLIIEPNPALAAACREKDLEVIEEFLESVDPDDLPTGAKAFVSFELFEHLHSPPDFLRCLRALMQPGDLFIFTTLSGTGVDVQVLWERSKSVSPPHHLNFLNPWAARLLLERLEFEVLEITTPGELDINILENDRREIRDRFWRTFVETADEHTKRTWQQVISASGWSSHMMVVCRRPTI